MLKVHVHEVDENGNRKVDIKQGGKAEIVYLDLRVLTVIMTQAAAGDDKSPLEVLHELYAEIPDYLENLKRAKPNKKSKKSSRKSNN